MMLVMVKEADLDRIEVPKDYEVLDATALGQRLGFKRATVLATSRGETLGAYLAPTASQLLSTVMKIPVSVAVEDRGQ